MTTGQEMIKMGVSNDAPEMLARAFENFVNSFTPDVDGFIQALESQSEAFKERFSVISLFWVKKMTMLKKGNWFDLRNQYSVETCEKISSILGERLTNFHPEYTGEVKYRRNLDDLSFEGAVVESLSNAHRTLQQSFSELVFTWFTRMGTAVEDETLRKFGLEITEKMDYMFYRTPCI